MNNDVFANPQPPSNYKLPDRDDSGQPLTNDDFRKLLMTPSASTVRGFKPSLSTATDSKFNKKKLSNEAAEKRKEKKLFYAALVNESKEKEAELAKKYRDRAKERREREKEGVIDTDVTSTTTNYRAVAPGFSLTDNAERRRQLIEESKYLGGDFEHTHLVKGLDYALLQKVKSDRELKGVVGDEAAGEDEDDKADLDDEPATVNKSATRKDNDVEEEDEDEPQEKERDVEEKMKMNLKPKLISKTTSAALAAALNKSVTDNPFAFKQQLEANKHTHAQALKQTSLVKKKSDSDLNESLSGDDKKVMFKTVMAKNIYRTLFEFKPAKTNELFQPNRMAYIVDLQDEETDIPITSIRSKADCLNNENNAVLTTNDIVINKLTQILSYLRHGKRDAKKLKKKSKFEDEKPETNKKPDNNPTASLSIYDDVEDYVPNLSKNEKSTASEVKKRNYFGESEKEKQDESLVEAPSKEAATEFIRNVNQKYANKEIGEEGAKKEEKKSGFNLKFDKDSYAECYPGTTAEEDVNIDSDEECDFTKMDLGNKKGPVNRWDFDTNEEYSDYMSNREALPKAAFQYGLKMADGRKTRRMVPDAKVEKVKLDKEWNQISRLIDKRKNGEYSNSDLKKIKY